MNLTGVVVSAEDIRRISRAVTIGQWGVASVVMVGSAMSAWSAFGHLGEHPVIGAVTALGVDLALSSGLVVSRRLDSVGVRTAWGTALLWLTGLMTLLLNSGAAARERNWPLAFAHTFLPILLVALTEAGSQAQGRLLHLQRHQEAAEQMAREAELAAQRAAHEAQRRAREDAERRRAEGELVDAQAVFDRAQELRRAAEQETQRLEAEWQEAARIRAQIEAEVAAAQIAREKIAEPRPATVPVSRPRRRTSNKGPVSMEVRKQWVRNVFTETGRLPTGAEVDREFGTTRSGCRVVSAVQEEIAEEKRRALHAITGGQR